MNSLGEMCKSREQMDAISAERDRKYGECVRIIAKSNADKQFSFSTGRAIWRSLAGTNWCVSYSVTYRWQVG